MQRLSEREISEALRLTLPSWQRSACGLIERNVQTTDWKATLMAVNAIGHACELACHHPELVVTYDRITIGLTTHDAGGITSADIELATQIDRLLDWRPSRSSAPEGTSE